MDNNFYLTNAAHRLTFSKAVDAVVVIVPVRVTGTKARRLCTKPTDGLAFFIPIFPPQTRLAFRQLGFFRFETEAA